MILVCCLTILDFKKSSDFQNENYTRAAKQREVIIQIALISPDSNTARSNMKVARKKGSDQQV